MLKNLKVGMMSLGCNKNTVDAETALGLLKDAGCIITSDPAEADVLMVNTCGFINQAKEQSIDAIMEMAQYKEIGCCKLLVVTGCLAQRYEEALMEEIPEIDLLMGVNRYSELTSAIETALAGQRQSDVADDYSYFQHHRVLTTPPFSAYTRIGEGCSNRCTFCAIPLIRGPYRSRPEEDVLAEIQQLAQEGVKEHLLVAQDTTRYGTDWQEHTALPQLLEKAAAIPGVEWLRVLYCYPDETNAELLDVMARHDNICKYLDLPIQHINDEILHRMHRKGNGQDIRRCLKLARERGFLLRTTVMVGFPGETEEQFQELLAFVKEAEFDRLGAFTYSAEEDTPAAKLPDQIDEDVKQDRYNRLLEAQQEVSFRRNQRRIGTVEKVLYLGLDSEGVPVGRSQYEIPEDEVVICLHFPEGATLPEPGTFLQVKITVADLYDLEGDVQ